MIPKRIFFFAVFLLASFVINAQTVLWATATEGGATNQGTILQADSTGTNFHAVYSLVNVTGAYPLGNMVLGNNGKIYGITFAGGYLDSCVIYSYDPATGIYTNIYDFMLAIQFGDGAQSGLIIGPNGYLYGLCPDGGQNYRGVIYTIDPATDTYQDIYDFNDSTGKYPHGGLMSLNGILYGMTTLGGIYNKGVIFSFDVVNSTYIKLFDFDGTTGARPMWGSLLKANSGKLYGMTYYGGMYGKGVMFSFDLSTNSYTDLFDFQSFDGVFPSDNLIQANNGLLYGLTSGGGSHHSGVLFSYNIDSNLYTKLFDFDSLNGINPYRSLKQLSDGKLYGTTFYGGSHNFGTIFNFDITNNTFTKLFDFDSINGYHPSCDILETPAIPTALCTLPSTQTFSIYPNPAINSITINGIHSPVEFVDVYGRVFKTLVTDCKANTIVDVSSFPNVFFVRDGEGMVKKVVRR